MRTVLLYSSLFLFLLSGSIVLAEDPDYGNNELNAYTIPTDNTEIYGTLDSGDVDWFKFSTPGFARYKVTCTNPIGNWKKIYVYQADEFGILREISNWWISGSSIYKTFFFEFPFDGYLAVTNDSGSYSVQVEALGITPADSFSNSCASPTALSIGSTVVGTLDHTDPYDTDWFVFATEPLHQYRIILTGTNNTSAWFRLFNNDCGEVYGNSTDITVTSWAGENYKLFVNGTPNYGNYYTIRVEDIGTYTDDVANLADNATPIPTNGTETLGTINYNSTYYSDIDWFSFTPTAHTKYRIIFTNYNANWKKAHVYQRNNVGDLVELLNWWSSNDVQARSFFFEFPRQCLVMVENDGGDYGIKVETQETQTPDTYPNECASAKAISINSTTIGTLDHTIPYDTDWFVFHTEPLHTYQITLAHLNNTALWFSLYPGNCGAQVYGNNNDMTVTSWYGEDYKIYVNGDVNRVGNYYSLTVTDIASYTDGQGNTWQEASVIPKDGTWVESSIDYISTVHSDLDWYKFTAGVNGSYTISFNNPESNWKKIHLYRTNEVGTPIEITSWWSSNSTPVQTHNLTAGQHYLMVESDKGAYRFSVLSPEPRCGDLDHPIMDGDVNKDCQVNLQDLAMMAHNWLECNHPTLCN